jgi:hypothetical protein
MSDEVRCGACGRALAPGALKFNVHVVITADFDGHLGEPGGEGSLESALERCEGQSEEELLADVHQELAFQLCGACRAKLVQGPALFLRHGGGMVQ